MLDHIPDVLMWLSLFILAISFGLIGFGSADLRKSGWLGLCVGCGALLVSRIVA